MDSAIVSVDGEALEFAPDILRLRDMAPSPWPRAMLAVISGLIACLLVWMALGRLDIIAVAQGRLVPRSTLQIVQPADGGIVAAILVQEGEAVRQGQVLARMDTKYSAADERGIADQLRLRELQLRRIDAELMDIPLRPLAGDGDDPFARVNAQYHAHRQAYLDALGAEGALLERTRHDFRGAAEIAAGLEQVLPIYREQERAYGRLADEGLVARLAYDDKKREYLEHERELRAQQATADGLRAAIHQSERRVAQIASNHLQQLQDERIEAAREHRRLRQEQEKQVHRAQLLDLRSPANGVVKDVATRTPGAVVASGTVLLTVVPEDDPLEAEVWIGHADAGLVAEGQPVRLKLVAYPFQRYGLAEGTVRQLSPDAAEEQTGMRANAAGYRARIALAAPFLERDGRHYRLTPGMQVAAEIRLGNRSVLEYLLAPVRAVLHDAGREH